jgi:hypothetical protein
MARYPFMRWAFAGRALLRMRQTPSPLVVGPSTRTPLTEWHDLANLCMPSAFASHPNVIRVLTVNADLAAARVYSTFMPMLVLPPELPTVWLGRILIECGQDLRH